MFNVGSDIITDYWLGKQEEEEEEKQKPAEEFKKFCEDEPWAPECKIFDI